MQLNFEIDKLTHSIEDAITGEIFPTEVLPFTNADLKDVTKKNGWKFNWKAEFADADKKVFKLVLKQQMDKIQGLVCFTAKPDYIFMDLIESAPQNYGRNKKYVGVPGNMVAFGCKFSFELGFTGEMAFDSKTVLIEHYIKTLGARHLGGQRMVIWTDAAIKLVNTYFPDFLINENHE